MFIELIHFLNGFEILIASFHDIKLIKRFVQSSKVNFVPTLFIVRRESAHRAAHIDVNEDCSIEDRYQTCIRLTRIDIDTSTGTPNLREPDTALAAPSDSNYYREPRTRRKRALSPTIRLSTQEAQQARAHHLEMQTRQPRRI